MQKIFPASFFFFFTLPLLTLPPPPPILLFVRGEGSVGRGHNVNRHTELLWCWLCFQNIFRGLIPIAGSIEYSSLFSVSILCCWLWNIYDGIWGAAKRERRLCHVWCRQHPLTLPVKRQLSSQVGIPRMSNMKSKYCEWAASSILLGGLIFSWSVFSALKKNLDQFSLCKMLYQIDVP